MFDSSRKAIMTFCMPSARSVRLQKSINIQRALRLKRMAAAIVSLTNWTDEPALINDVQRHAV